MDALKTEILAALKRFEVPGAIISIRSKKYGNLEIFYGYSDVERRIKMRDSKELPWKIGSITKSFTGTMILQMLDEGKVDLDRSIDRYLMGIPNGQNITLRQVGNMRSGIYNYSESDRFAALNATQPHRVWSPSELLAMGITQPPYFPPGTDIHYSNTNSVILGLVIERLNPVNGSPGSFEKELYKRMIDPLKLRNTSFSAVIEEPCIHGYLPNGDGTYTDITDYNDTWGWSAGQMISDLPDLHRYLRLSVAKHITISDYAAEQQRDWASEMTRDGVTVSYGFQMEKIGDYYIGHNGSLPGYSNYGMVNEKTRTTVVVMCNIQNTTDGVNPSDYITEQLITRALP